jgi:hypothetical protein
MTDKITPERIAALAKAARVPLPETSPERITNATAAVILRMAEEKLALDLGVEPATYLVVAREGAKR